MSIFSGTQATQSSPYYGSVILQGNMLQTVTIGNLSHAKIMQKVTPKKAVLPILTKILFELDPVAELLTMVCTDLQVGLKITASYMGSLKLKTTIDTDQLSQLIEASGGDLQMCFDSAGTLTIKTTYTSKKTGLDPADFPYLPRFEPGQQVYPLSKPSFAQELNRISFACASDQAKSILTGVTIKTTADGTAIASTDGYRLAVKNFSYDQASFADGLIIPAYACQIAGKAFKKTNYLAVYYSQDHNSIVMSGDGITLTTRLIEGKYPDYNKILPKSTAVQMKFTAGDFLKALKPFQKLVSKQTHVILTFVFSLTGN